MTQTGKYSSSHAEAVAGDLSFDEVIRCHLGQWVLLRVTAFDDSHIPSRGEVVAHGPEKRVRKVLESLGGDRWNPPYYIFCAYPRVRSGEALRAAIAEAARQGDAGARRPW